MINATHMAELAHWRTSLIDVWPADADDPEGAWIIGAIGQDGVKYDVITVEADQYDAPGDSEKIARALITLWAQAFAAPPAQPDASLWRDALGVASGLIGHSYNGSCPDALIGHDKRDEDCPACRVIMRIDAALADAMLAAAPAAQGEPVAVAITEKQVMTAYISAGRRHISGTSNWVAAFARSLNKQIAAAPAAPEADLSRDERVAALCDLSYRAGLKAGWNYCVDGDETGFARSMESARGAVDVLAAHRRQGDEQ